MDAEAHKAACLARFREAVRMGRNQDYTGAQTIVHHVRATHGDKAAETARRELFNFIKSEKSAHEPSQAVGTVGQQVEEISRTITVKRGSRTTRTR
jgi:hypothetical protein